MSLFISLISIAGILIVAVLALADLIERNK